ncbi:hypothetical protein L596_006643 [Steinernema carpocapsae]|uniref:Cyclic nucleotide-binding domain-containing protein n=1 Tax=Steinernema carpocapsae TaxID=34508 RepID=A0A4U8V596_STECR|nr:hypothetical protein L596_006643 [Steinernema carpocapsae]
MYKNQRKSSAFRRNRVQDEEAIEMSDMPSTSKRDELSTSWMEELSKPSTSKKDRSERSRSPVSSVRIEVEGVERGSLDHLEHSVSIPEGSYPPSEIPSARTDGATSSLLRADTTESDFSFIMREKLHVFARDIQRRTSQVLEDVVRDPSPEPQMPSESDATVEGMEPEPEKKKTTLMELLGLDQGRAEDEDEPTDILCIPRSIDPYSNTYMFWLFIVVSAFLYNAIIIPLRSSYPYQNMIPTYWWLLFDYSADFIYLLDMIIIKPRLQFMKSGISIKSRKQMLGNYLSSSTFRYDVISLLPTDVIYLWTGIVPIWRFVRVLKVTSYWQLFNLLDNSVSNPYVIRITKTFSYMIYLIHCNSCVYYMLSAWQAFGQLPYRINNQYFLNSWVYNNLGNAYIRCFYFTAAVATSTGNNPAPTNVIEYIYMTFSWMMGVFVFALLLGQIRDIVSNANKNRENFRSTMDLALSECKRLQLPKHTIDRVRDWFIYTWEQQKTLDEKKLIEKLPLKLQTDLALSVHFNTLSKVSLFQDCDDALMRDLVLKLRPVIFLPGDMICKKGDVGKEMYIVNQGILEVVGGERNEILFTTLKEGNVFGEISLLAIDGNNRRTANIRSKGYSTLFSLSKEDLNDVMKDYPEAQQLLHRKAQELLNKDKKEVKEKTDDDVRREFEEKCRIRTSIATPRMLETVAKVLNPQSGTTRKLKSAMSTSSSHRNSLKRWSTIPDDFPDESEVSDEEEDEEEEELELDAADDIEVDEDDVDRKKNE